MLPRVTSFAPLECPLPLRRHQAEALAAVEEAQAAGSTRWWVTMPPGAGKTLVGTEVVRRLGRRAVVFSPNTAIQHQWAATWNSYDGPHAGTHRDLRTPVTSLTYQSLAVFDDESSDEVGTHVDRLHPHGQALVQTLRDAGPVTLVLDECHHLMEVWGELLREVLESLPEAVVLGLTATPPAAMSRAESDLADTLFGHVLHQARIPALVVEGTLAPYAELAWLTTPTTEEADWLAAQATRFAELTSDLYAPGFGSTTFPAWVTQRFVTPAEREGAWSDLATREPELTDAALRLVAADLMVLPAGAQVREQHRRDLAPDDWRLLLDDWVAGCVRPGAEQDESDQQVLDALRRTLPSIGYTLTARGIRPHGSTVDRVTARSASKQEAVTQILTAEHADLGESARALVLCDFERAPATTRARLSDDEAPPPPAGSATGVLRALLDDPACAALEPMMVTGATVAGGVSTLETLVVFIEQTHPGVAGSLRIDESGPVPTLTGRWTSGQWVAHVTRFLTAGGTRALVGTRGLLGEGWDAPCLTTLVDLTTATTPTAVVQTRGRALRTDPEAPDKVALIWSVVCVFDRHSAGSNDWDRFARKHRGYFTVDESGTVVDGVAGVDSTFGPFAPPAVPTFDSTNARMLTRAEDRPGIRERWQSRSARLDRVDSVVRVRRTTPARSPAEIAPESPRPWSTARRERPQAWLAAATVVLAAVVSVSIVLGTSPAWWLAVVVLLYLTGLLRGRSVMLAASRHRPGVAHVAHAVADGLHAAGLAPVGADHVRTAVAPDGSESFHLADVDEPTSARFATALEQAVAPLSGPRYVVRRDVTTAPHGLDWVGRAYPALVGRVADGEVWHAVPDDLARTRDLADAYAKAWRHWLGGGEAIYAGSPEGAGVLAAQRGTDPLDVTCVIRKVWS